MTKPGAVKEMMEENKAELSITPMIDVVFLLLIFFLLASRFKASEGDLKAYLPKDRGQGTSTPTIDLYDVRVKLLWYDDQNRPTTDTKTGHVVLKVGKEVIGSRVLEDTVTRRLEPFPDYEELYERLIDFKGSYKGKSEKGLPVIIDARKQVPWKHVVFALDACMLAGIKDITFAAPAKPID
ncbi:MAG: biopolymer transporter ExbD [Planctomycetota bacterium]|nr:biopolymer transporter ExbD [Planctomycetota bacterium]